MSEIELIEENLLPIYILEDKLKQNFKKTNHFMQATRDNNEIFRQHISKIEIEQTATKKNFQEKMVEMEKKIIQEISLELQGRIAIAISKSIQSFTEKLQKKEKDMDNISSQFDKKLEAMKKNMTYQIAQENQKFFLREGRKLEDKFQNILKNQGSVQKNSDGNLMSKGDLKGEQSENWQSQHHNLKSLESRVEKLEDFSVNVEKRFYNSITSLKDSWKQLGTELLQNKKNLSKKFDQLKADLIKLKNMKDFAVIPQKIESDFKRKLTQKFTDIYQLLGVTLTKKQFESTIERVNQKITRHDDQFLQIRKELADNNEFFTFYANNSDQDDLKRLIVQLEEKFRESNLNNQKKINAGIEQNNKRVSEIADLEYKVIDSKQYIELKSKKIDKIAETVDTFQSRVRSLEDFNHFGPAKLQKIHNSLQVNFSADEQQLLNNKQKKNYEMMQKQFKVQVSKLKDELFIMSSQNQVWEEEMAKIKKSYHQMEEKMSKLKLDNEEAMVSRKPWVCLSCDKQEKQKEQQKKQSKKRLQPFKGFGPQKGSQKSIKFVTPPYEQRFQVYERFREKYLSDTVKLPEIYKQKIKDGKQSSFQA